MHKDNNMKLLIINGPNLNLLGRRQPEIYGSATFDDCLAALHEELPDVEIIYFQSNFEGAIIDTIHSHGFDTDLAGIIINPGAFAHYSYALADAITSVPARVVEVHISNIHARKEEFRHKSVTAPGCEAIISGCGLRGYSLAARYLLAR